MRSLRARRRGPGFEKRDLEVAGGVTIAQSVQLTGQGQLLGRVLSNRLEQLVLTAALMLQHQ